MSDHIDAVAHLQRAARPSRHVPADNGALRPKAPTPTLLTPAIARPTVWAASQMSYEEVLDAVRDLELATGATSPKHEFLGHFAQRKLELGTCGRAYGTGCQHEHACIRCPMLRPDPDQHERLQHIIDSLEERIAEATERGWLGEADGLKASLAAAKQKLTQMRRTATNLGMPIFSSRSGKRAVTADEPQMQTSSPDCRSPGDVSRSARPPRPALGLGS